LERWEEGKRVPDSKYLKKVLMALSNTDVLRSRLRYSVKKNRGSIKSCGNKMME
jgi:hypothetical protein